MQTVQVKTHVPYSVHIGHGILDTAGTLMGQAGISAHKIALISDSTVNALYGHRVAKALAGAGYQVARIQFPPGENHKTMDTLSGLLQEMAQAGLTRGDCVLALGGGVTGDIAGFAASVYMRGLPYVQMPTTFLAAVDSSVGGKTAVDLPMGKNLAGSFHQPSLVICDCETFATLPEQIFLDGVAEGMKAGILGDLELFEAFRNGSYRREITRTVARCVAIKARIVEADPLEKGERHLLNFGHTIAHAVERHTGYAVSHGHAVAIGMAGAARAAKQMGYCQADVRDNIVEAVRACGLPAQLPYLPKTLCEAALSDKKRDGDTIILILPRKIGHVELVRYPLSELPAFFRLAGETT